LPAAVFDHIEYLFSHNGGVSQTLTPAVDGGDAGSEFELESGNWTVTVNAYAGPGNDTLAASGTESFTIILGEETGVTVKLSPVVSEGTGNLSYALTYPGGTAVNVFTLTLLADENDVDLIAGATLGSGNLTGTKAVNAGYYLAHAVLQKDGITAGKTEIAHIYRNMATNLSFAFTDNDFKATLVFSSADAGPGSLREAIANALPDGAIALMLPEDDKIITLKSTIAINKNLTILGNGAILTQSGFNGSLVTVSNSAVAISRIHFKGARKTTGNGGALSVSGPVTKRITLESCIFSDNHAGGDGGAVHVSSSVLDARGSTFYKNSASGSGGAINGAGLVLTGNLFYGNAAASNPAYAASASSSYNSNASDVSVAGSRTLNTLPISPLSFRPLGGLEATGAEGVIASRPAAYPAADFQGKPIPDTNAAAGAIQTATAAGLYFLDYAAAGPGTVSVSSGSVDEDGLTSGAVKLSVTAASGGFRYWLVDGAEDLEQRSATLTLDVNAHATVRAVIYAEVSVPGDNVPGSLRDAIANAAGSGVIIPSGISPVLYDDLTITESLVIEGKGAAVNLNGHHIVISGATTKVAISRVHFKGGATANGYGGAIQNGGILTIESCIFSNNQVTGTNARGGAVYTTGTLTVLGSTFYGNSAGSGQGGAVWRNSGTLNLQGNLFWGNTAASYAVAGGTPTSQGFNISDKPKGASATDSGFSHADDAPAASLPLSSVSFRPFATGDAVNVITQRPGGYPTADFYGEDIPDDNAATGAAQSAITPSGYILDYAAQGPGAVEFTGARDEDGFVNSSVTLRAVGKNDTVTGTFKHWIVDDGAERQESDNPLTLDLSANTTVRAVFGGVWTASSDANSGPGSFREALGLIADGDTIILDGQTIILTEPLAATAKKFTIQGNGATLTQSGFSGSLLSFSSGAEAKISRVWFKGARATGDGGAIFSARATLTLESCVFSDNRGSSGGGICVSSGALTIYGCTFYGNNATGNYGGAIYSSGSGTVTLTGNIFWGNTPASSIVSPSSVTASYTISDGTISGSAVLASQPLSPVSLKPIYGGDALGVVASKPLGYPDEDFYGVAITDGAAAGAIQTPTATAGYVLYYEAEGPGTVSAASPNAEGLYSGNVTLTATADTGKELLYWIVDGTEQPEQDPPNELTLNGYAVVQALFATVWRVNTDDSGEGSLRDALAYVLDGDKVVLPAGQTITLATPLPEIAKRIVIEGNGATLTQSGFVESDASQLLRIGSLGEVRISRILFKGGRAADYAAAIYNAGKLTLESCIFSDNRTGAWGGALYSAGGSVTVLGSSFYKNAAGSTGFGGAIYRGGGTLSLTGNIFWENTGMTFTTVYPGSSGSAYSGGFNISDKPSGQFESGWGFTNGDTQLASLPIFPVNFKPFAGGAGGIIVARPEGYPTVDFYGATIPAAYAAAGAVQAIAAGYMLDYDTATVDRTLGNPDIDGLYTNSVILEVPLAGGNRPAFLYWIVNGDTLPAQAPPYELTLNMNGHKTVRAVFADKVVTSNGDNGAGTLRDAINSAAAGDIILLPAGATITLETALPQITKSITIEGNGATLTRSFEPGSNTSLLYISSSAAEVRINRLHFMSGRATGNGGAIYDYSGKLTLESCVFSDNQTTSSSGGAIYTAGNTTISGCTFYGNVAGTGYGYGGAIYGSSGTLTLTGNIFWGNTAYTNPVVYRSGGAATGGYNVSDTAGGTGNAQSGWTFANGDTKLDYLPIVPGSFKPFAGVGADRIIATRPTGYPAVDFYGVAIPASNAAAGAAQTTVTGYMLDYDAGTVDLIAGTDTDGLYNGNVTLEVPLTGNRPAFLYWTVNGAVLPVQAPPYGLTLNMNGHKTVRAVFADKVVTSNADNGSGTLRDAISNAVAGDIILLPAGETITLTATLPQITKSLVIEGNGATLTRSFSSSSNTQLLYINSSTAEVRINRLHFMSGRATSYGGAIQNRGKLILESCVFSDNQTTSSSGYGGAIYTTGNTTISGCTFYGNVAGTGYGYGGAIYRSSGTLTLTGNIFWGNTAYTNPVVYYSGGAATGGYNVSDTAGGTGNAQSGWTFANGDTKLDYLPIVPGSFKPFAGGGADSIIAVRPEGYPTVDFYGAAISVGSVAAGAAQTAVTNYMLDYAEEGPGTVSLGAGTIPDSDGLYAGNVTLTAAADFNKNFLIWIVNGAIMPPQTPPEELTIYMDGNKTVRGVFGSSITVTSAEDNGAGTLRQALLDAADKIVLPAEGIITLTATLPQITKSLIIEGNGATLTRSFSSGSNTQLLYINSATAEVRISRLLFKDGRSSGYGGAIYNYKGALTLESCVFSGNQSSSYGGAIYNESSLNISGCTFTNNTGSLGGAIYSYYGGTLSLTGNIFAGNTGGSYPVVYAYTSSITGGYNVSDKAGGTSSGQSGWIFAGADVPLTDVTFSGAATGDFTPSSSASLSIIPSLPAGFPTTYFDGTSRGNYSTPGAMPE
jgi:predicted outer membrane repeat protein